MGLFDFLHKKPDKQVIDDKAAGNGGFLQHAQVVASIIEKSVQTGEFSGVSDSLKKYIYTGNNRAVFDHEAIIPWIVFRLIAAVSTIGFLCFLPVATGILAYSKAYRQYGFYITGIVIVTVVFNILLWRTAGKEIHFLKRYEKYQNILRYRKLALVEDLAGLINVKSSTVENDLKKAVKTKLIPNGHFAEDNRFFMVTDETFNRYSVSKAAYDRYFNNMMEDRNRLKALTKKTEDNLEKSEFYLGKIRDCTDTIKKKEVSDNLNRTEKFVSTVFYGVDTDPSKANILGFFIECYLTTTEKLLQSYIDIDEKQEKIGDLRKAKKDRVQALNSLNNVYESLLERFYEEQELEVAKKISSLQLS